MADLLERTLSEEGHQVVVAGDGNQGFEIARSSAFDVIVLDVTDDAGAFAAAGLAPDSADVVLMNPPFNDPARHRASPDQARASAHMAPAGMLAAWIHAARRDGLSAGQRPDHTRRIVAILVCRGRAFLDARHRHRDERLVF